TYSHHALKGARHDRPIPPQRTDGRERGRSRADRAGLERHRHAPVDRAGPGRLRQRRPVRARPRNARHPVRPHRARHRRHAPRPLVPAEEVTMPTMQMPQAVLRKDPSRPPALLMRNVTKTYDGAVTALDRVSFQVPRGSFLAVMGPSGSGKSTLLHCAAGLDSPTDGEVLIGGTEISRLNETKRTMLRRDRIGFVFQAYNLLPSLTVEENITLPLRLSGAAPDRRWLIDLVERVGIGALLR